MQWKTQTVAARAEQREAARSLARALLAATAPKALLSFDPEFGFPFAVEAGALRQFVSIAHGGALVAAAVDDHPVGIDVEPLTRDAVGPAHRIAGPAEQRWLAVTKTLTIDGQTVSPSLALWCAKEAAAKGVGLGIRAGIDRLQLEPNNGGFWPVRVAVDTPHTAPTGFQVRFFVIQGHLVALAAR